ncbi:unnamed protein product [Oikopleura dioica]|uniref:[histone H3]-lysine(27) N-trimethyltransferase n=1 Tax=Oikopleura dioica TaxID=34765 RepID=E4XQW8_OIKDI|nr:unnamed protein product [Oikopleura dioica]
MESEERAEPESSARLKVQKMNWKKIAGNELLKVQSKINTSQQDKIRSLWNTNREKTRAGFSHQKHKDENEVIDPSDEQPQYNYRVRLNTKISSFRETLSSKKHEVLTHTLPMIPNLPVSFQYMPSHKNIACDDVKVLQNIPYMGDDIVEHERGFLDDLINMHQRKMHCGGGDETIHELVDHLFSLEKDKDCSAEEPCQEIFEALSCLLADKGTPEAIRDKWNEANLNKSVENEHSTKLPSIDDPNAVWESQKRDKCLNSFHELICPRCYRYDCMYHTFQAKPPARTYLLKRKLDMPRVPINPCSKNCFLHLENGREIIEQIFKVKKIKPKTTKKIKKVQEDVETLNSPENSRDGFETKVSKSLTIHLKRTSFSAFIRRKKWTQSESVLMRTLVEIYQGNLCTISSCMGGRSCKSIFAKIAFDDSYVSSSALDESLVHKTPKKKLVSNGKRKTIVRKDVSAHNMHNYEPCDHPNEPCREDNCLCHQKGNYCEKFCPCPSDCRNRFSGCNCKGQCNTNLCPCYVARRECDPYLCKLCGADDFAKDFDETRCNNIKMQRGLHHHLLMAPSDIAGWGCYAKNDIKKNDYISDYCGELISQEEADRRGKVYDKHKCSFLFDLNSSFCIDATRKGNKIRFANHSMNPNAATKIIRVNGDHRIGIFAKTDIRKGEELFFDYRYSTSDAIKYVGIERQLN